MFSFDIYTDSSCDLTVDIIRKFDLKVMQLEVNVDDRPPVLNRDVEVKRFYEELRNGADAKTSAVTPGFFEQEMRKSLEAGRDILYLGFSSGLSVTYNNGVMVMEELKGEYPDRKLLYTDTLCASIGQGLVVYYAAVLREAGASIEEILDKVDGIKDRVHHLITVDDLFFLKRGGRISAATAIAGTVLKFKPIIHVDKEGHLINVAKVRGRKSALNELFTRMKERQKLTELSYVFISHADCLEDAQYLAELIKKEWNPDTLVIGDIGPVIGAHTGPGGLALCYLGKDIKGV